MTCWNSTNKVNFSVHERSHATMRNDTVVRFRKKDEVVDPLTQLLREGAQQLISQAVSAKDKIRSTMTLKTMTSNSAIHCQLSRNKVVLVSVSRGSNIILEIEDLKVDRP